MSDGRKEIEFPLVQFKHCTTSEHCEALRRCGVLPFWWYQDSSHLGRNFSLPFQDNLGRWWYQVRAGFAWPVDALDPISGAGRRLPYRRSYLGFQHLVPESEIPNSTLTINTIIDLPRYGIHLINDKRRNAIRKGAKACEVFAVDQVNDAWLDGAVRAWNDLVDRTGWKHHRDRQMLRETWTRLLSHPATTILLAVDRATSQLAGFLITRIYGRTAYVDTIASNSDLLRSNPNDILMYTFIRNTQRIPGVELLHFAIKSNVEPLERFKNSIGCVPYPYPAALHTRPGMMAALRIVNPKLYTRLTGKEPHAGMQTAEAAPVASPRQKPAAPTEAAREELDDRRREAATVEKSWYVPPCPNPPAGWHVYSLEFVLSAMQGSLTEPYQIKKSMHWLVFGTIVRSLMAVSQAIIMLLVWSPVVSSFLEVMARTFTRNAAGFFLRSCYWKARLGRLGVDTLIDQGVEIWGPANVSIGSRCHVDTNVRLAAGEKRHGQRGSIIIGDYVHLGPGVHIAGRGGVQIGDLVGIMANAHLYSATGTIEKPSDPGQLISMSHMAPRDHQHVYEAPIVVEEYAFIGMMARIMPGVTIGRGAIVHANTEVTRDIAPFTNYGGLPRGKRIGWRKPRRISPKLLKETAPSDSAPQAAPPDIPPINERGGSSMPGSDLGHGGPGP